MTKHDTFNYVGILCICAILILSMLYVQKHIDSLASTYNRQSNGTIERTPQKPTTIKKVSK